MKVLSLFDGISCGMVALERAEIPVDRYVAYEIEPSAIKISEKNYPQIERCGDVTTADFTQYQGFDLLIGGSPCQSLSIIQAHKRTNLDGKSKLFFEFVRAMEEVQPKFFLFENVASMNHESKQVISEFLGCQPIFIDSNRFVAQDRPRYYWTNIPFELVLPPTSPATLKDIMQKDVSEKYFYNFPLEGLDMSKKVCAHMVHNNLEMHRRVYNPAAKVGCLTAVCGGNPDGSVDLIATDPPYNIARKNNFQTMGRSGIDFGEWDKGFDQFAWLEHIPRILSKDGSVVIFNDWKNLGEIAKTCEALGLIIKDMLRWEKSNPMPRNMERRYITDFECAVWLTNKNAKWQFHRLHESYQRPVFKHAVVSGTEKVHPTQKPVKLMEEIIKIHSSPDAVVLDPFMGSGSTGVACVNTGRQFIGMELDSGYFEIAQKRIEEAAAQKAVTI